MCNSETVVARSPSAAPSTIGPTTRIVTIYVNDNPFQIRSGDQKVHEIKRIAGVPECDELAQIKAGEPITLPPDGIVRIVGEERFLSFPGSCGSS